MKTPWQSIGAKCVTTLSSKLMLALLPPQTSFFKLQLDESQLGEEFSPEVKTELDLSFAKIERTIMESIAASDDRVIVHQALKHLVTAGNALIFMSPKGLKLYPLNRYVVERDGNGNVIEIVTKERVSKKLVKKFFPEYKSLNLTLWVWIILRQNITMSVTFTPTSSVRTTGSLVPGSR